MPTLSRYLLTRVAGRFAMLLGVFLAVIVGGQLAIYISRGVPPEALMPVVGTFTLFALPIALPLALTTAVLVTLGQMNRDGELRALAAAGVSQAAVALRLAPMVIAGALISAALSHLVLPQVVGEIRQRKASFLGAAVAQKVAEQEPILSEKGAVLWAGSARGHRIRDVYALSNDGEQQSALFASDGRWAVDAQTGRVVLMLNDVQLVRRDLSDGALSTARLPHMEAYDSEESAVEREPDGMSTAEVLGLIATTDPLASRDDRARWNNARLTLHLRFFMPLALIAFALFAAGLAMVAGTAENLLGVVIIIVVVALSTYPAIGYVKSQAGAPQISPGWLLWPPALALAAIGWALLRRPDAARDLAESALAIARSRFARRWRAAP